MDIIGRDETFFEHGFRVSGVRPALAFSHLIRRRNTLVRMSNFHAVPKKLGYHRHFSKLNDDILISDYKLRFGILLT